MGKRILLLLSMSGLLLAADSLKTINNVQDETDWNKSFGIEISPIYLILSEKNYIDITGSFSLFNISNKIELAFPFRYIDIKDTDLDWYDDIVDYNQFTIDCIPRLFFKGQQKGFYFSAGLRYTYEYGIDEELYWDTDELKYYSKNKIGISFGIGYRYFSPLGLYWGFSLFGGRYFTGNDVLIDNLLGMSLSPNLFLTAELLKFGYAF